MVCPYCQHKDTAVINSRQHKSQPRIWRRRECMRCKTAFTTYERVAQKELPTVHHNNDDPRSPFSTASLMISIYTHLPHSPRQADHAQALAESVYDILSERTTASLTTKEIADTTYGVLKRFNPRSGLSYGVTHNIITPDSLA